MSVETIEHPGVALAHARLNGILADRSLSDLIDLDQAEAVQSQAVRAYGRAKIGYSMQATSLLTQRRLGCRSPIFGPLFDSDVRQHGSRIHLPRGVLGAGCAFVFTLGRSFPAAGEDVTASTISEAIVECRPMIQILARRVSGSAPLNALTATADFALDALSVTGDRLARFQAIDLAAFRVTARINGNVMAAGCGGDVLGHPFEAVAWLARVLAARGRGLNAGDLVATGSCVGILQVIQGQTLEADFAELATLTVNFA